MVSKSNPRFFGGYELYGAHNFYFGRSDLIIGTGWLHRVLEPCLARESDSFNNSRFLGGEFFKIRYVELRNLPIFGDIFVSKTPILALRRFKTGRKQQKPREGNLKFPKLFSD